jgi:hypothetical protein
MAHSEYRDYCELHLGGLKNKKKNTFHKSYQDC